MIILDLNYILNLKHEKTKLFPEQKQNLPGNEYEMTPEPEIIRAL